MDLLVQFCATFSAETNFEKAKIAATYQNTDPPKEKDIKQIIKTFTGGDNQTTIQNGFESFIRRLKLQNYEDNGWTLIIKSLIIIDRCVNDGILLNEIISLELPYVECRQERNQKNKQLLLNELISKYYTYIKCKCGKLRMTTSLNIFKQEKILYFKELNINQVVKEIVGVIDLAEKVFEIIETKKNGHLRFKVNHYVFLLLLYDLMKYYGCSIIGFNYLLKKLTILGLEELLQLLAITKQMFNFSTKFDEFIHQCRFIQGFEQAKLDYRITSDIVNLVETYIDTYEKNEKHIKDKKIKLKSYETQGVIELLNQGMTEKPSIFFEPIKLTQPTKLQYFVNSFKTQFEEQIFCKFKNNYSTQYQEIFDEFQKPMEIQIQEGIDFLLKVEEEQNKFNVNETIHFLFPIPFNEKLFTSFQNSFNK